MIRFIVSAFFVCNAIYDIGLIPVFMQKEIGFFYPGIIAIALVSV